VIQSNFPAPAWLDLKTFAPQPSRRGVAKVQLDLFGDYKSSVALYPTF
jgi:hypothetical protein